MDRRAATRGAVDPGRGGIGSFIARFAGTDRYVVDYLVEEVLNHQTQPVRELLLRTAILERFTRPLG